MIDNLKLIEELNDLMVINYDGREGYLNAMDNTDHAVLKHFFSVKYKQRDKFIKHLYAEIIALGGAPKEEGSVLGKVHRSWMDLKSLVTGNDEESILDACETGEKAAIMIYDKVLENDGLSDHIISLLNQQRRLISKSLRSVENLEEVFD